MAERQAQVESLWNERRKKLHEILMDINDGLAELYKRAIDELDLLPSEEMSAVTRSTVSYYGRELLNNLPDFLTADGALPPRGQYQELQAQSLRRVVELVGVSDLPNTATDGQRVFVSGELAVAIRDLAEAYEKGSMSRRQRDSVTILGRVQDNVAANGLLKEAREVLTDHQHANLTQADSVIAKSAFMESFKTIEDLLLAHLGSFFDTAQELRALMRLVEDTDPAEEPDVAETVREVLLRLGDYQHRRVFYGGIRSSKWMPHLKDRGAFIVGTQDTADGENFLRWPEGDYLASVASECADDVLEICLDAGQSHNPYVQAKVLSAAAKLPGDKAMSLHQVALAWSKSMRTMRYYFEPHDAAQLVANLFSCSLSKRQIKKAEKVLKAFFSPTFEHAREGANYSRTQVAAAIPEYCYREELEYVVRYSGGRCGYRQISLLLERYERQYCESQHLEYGASNTYLSWRPSIALPGHPYPSDYGNHLVDAYVQALRAEAGQRPGCLVESYQSKSTLVSRSALHVLSELVTKVMTPIQGGEEPLSTGYETVRCLAQSILDDPELLHKGIDAEAIALTQACMAFPRIFDMRIVVNAIGAYRNRKEKTHAASFWLQGLTEDERYGIANRQAVGDEHLLLARIGGTVLPQTLAMRLAELDAELGVISDDDLAYSSPFGAASWGYVSPVTVDQLLQMPTNELYEFLCGWQPNSVHDEPSVLGLANALQQAVSQDAAHFTGLLGSVESLRPRYIGALLKGMSSVIGNRNEASIDDLAAACSRVCSRVGDEVGDESRVVLALAEDYDPRYDAGDLAERLALGEAALSPDGWGCLLETGVSLSEVLEPNKEGQLVESYPDDPITVLINLLRPKGVEILARVAGHCTNDSVRQEAMTALKRLMTRQEDALVYGALGMAFLPLVTCSRQFAQELVSEVLHIDRADLSIALAYPALYRYGYDHETLCVLRPIIHSILLASREDNCDVREPLTSRTMVRIGYWLYVDREAGHMTSDDALYLLWRESATIEERKNVLHEVCHRASYEGASAVVVKRAMDYWDEVREYEQKSDEIGELTGAFLLAHNPAVQTEWLAPRMVIEASEKDVSDELVSVSRRLVDVARVKPADAIAVLEHAASTQSGIEHVALIGRRLFQVFAYAFASHNESVNDCARALMDKLGRQGMIELDERVREAMEDFR